MKNQRSIVFIVALSLASHAIAGWFSPDKEGRTFQTKGTALIMASGTFTTGIEKRGIQIPEYIDTTSDSMWLGLRHDSESGWTKCRLPLRSSLGVTGVTERTLVFDCKPLTYFPAR